MRDMKGEIYLTPRPGMRVEVYWNLHRLLWSVRHKGRVIAHVKEVDLMNVEWVVQPAGRARVLRERRKNVHAFARGTIPDEDLAVHGEWGSIKYNPYTGDSFTFRSEHRDGTFDISQSYEVAMSSKDRRPVVTGDHRRS